MHTTTRTPTRPFTLTQRLHDLIGGHRRTPRRQRAFMLGPERYERIEWFRCSMCGARWRVVVIEVGR
jgi:hypothetical protein